MKNLESSLPPGFRFHPTDEELILHYLTKKIASMPLPVSIIAEVDIYKFDPWDLPAKAAFGEKEWYFFSPRDRKYPNGARPNRAAASGYWKATGTDKTIVAPSGAGRQNVGVKKALVFYKGKPPKGIKTNWIMHEYRLPENSNNYTTTTISRTMKPKDLSMRLDDWVLCRIYKKPNIAATSAAALASDQEQEEEEEEEDFLHDILLPSLQSPLLPLSHTNSPRNLKPQKSSSFSNLLDAMDYSLLTSFLADGHYYGNPTATAATGLIQSTPNHQLSSFNNNYTSNVIGGSSSYSSHSSLPKLPQLTGLNLPSVPKTENRLKRKHSITDDRGVLYPSKKYINSNCTFTNIAINQSGNISQGNLLNRSLLNQHLLFE